MSGAGVYSAVSLVLPIALAGAPARADSSIGSSAFDIAATFTSDSMTATLGPVNPVQGAYPPAYLVKKTLPLYSGSVTLPPLVPQPYPIVADLDVAAAGLTSSVQSKGVQLDFVDATASASVKAATLDIDSTAATPRHFLDIKTDGVKSSATYSLVLPSAASVSGAVTIGSLHIAGTLLDGESVDYSGSPAANTVLFENENVTVIANEQIIPVIISCAPACAARPASITVNALAVHLNNPRIQNGKVSGAIVLGQAAAY